MQALQRNLKTNRFGTMPAKRKLLHGTFLSSVVRRLFRNSRFDALKTGKIMNTNRNKFPSPVRKGAMRKIFNAKTQRGEGAKVLAAFSGGGSRQGLRRASIHLARLGILSASLPLCALALNSRLKCCG